MEMLSDMLDLLGCTIRFQTYEGEYEGIVKRVCPSSKRITISKIIFGPKQIFMGVLNFFCHEIISYTVVSRPSAIESTSEPTLIQNSYSRAVTTDTFCFPDEYEVDENVDAANSVYLEDVLNEDYVLKLPSKFCEILPLDSVILETADNDFHLAVRHLRNQSVIGVSFEGPKINRRGILSWVCISTAACTFLFDIQSLQKKAFDCGLREVFENEDIEKVIHDCREASDCLFHQFNTRLVNIFDTQVADYIISAQRSKEKAVLKYVNPINSCLYQHLNVPQEFLYVPKKYYTYDAKVLSFSLRPISSEFRDLLIKNTIYLKLLKDKLLSLLLNPFRRAVGIYANVLQSASEQELLLEPSIPDMVPPAVLMDGIQTVCFKEFFDIADVVTSGPPYHKLKDPLKDAINLLNKCSETSEMANRNLVDKLNDKNKVNILKCIPEVSCKHIRSQMKNGSSSSNVEHLENLNVSNKKSTTEHFEKQVSEVAGIGVLTNKSKSSVDLIKRTNALEISGDENDLVIDVSDGYRETKEMLNNELNVNSNSRFKMKSSNSDDVWSCLRSAFEVTDDVFENFDQDTKKKIIFIPAGMAEPVSSCRRKVIT